jgi:hypothetical protein
MIPKIIHYCWFGEQEKGELIRTCISSWKNILPDYEVIEWNEGNILLDCDFAQKASGTKKWAFLSDYIRLKVLAEFGGVYLDTDMLFIKELGDLLYNRCFIGRQENGQIAAGIIGCMPGHPFIIDCVEKYQSMPFDEQRLMNMAIPKIITEQYDLFEKKADINILDYEFFYPYLFEDSLDGVNYNESIKPETIAVHLWNASWFTKKESAGFEFERKRYLRGLKLLAVYYLENPRYILDLPALIFRHLKRKAVNEN